MLFETYNILGMKEQANSQQYIDEYQILKQLGSGYQAIVYLAIDGEGNRVAIKKYKKIPSVTNNIEEQLEAMQHLHHENLIRLISIRQNAIFKDKMQLVSNCFAIILQYAAGGQLFDFIADTGKFSEKVTRTYFHQLMNGIHYIHEKGYAHRDIKPQNLLLSETFVLKIADFGFCCLLKGRDGKGILKTKLGTQGYMAPQIFCKQYDGRKTDIFAAGVILFIMYTGTPPFEKAIPSDPYYKLIKEKKMVTFWQSHSKKKPYGYFSDGFKDLFQKMTANDPEERLNIFEIAKHPWVKSGICTHSEIKKQFSERKERLMRVLDERRRQYEQQQKFLNNQISSQENSYRGESSCSDILEEYYKLKLLKHNWPEMQEGRMHLLIKNHDTEFVMCMLKQHLQSQQFDLHFKTAQEEDLIESEYEDFIMKAEQVIPQNKTLKVKYCYSTYLKKMEIPHHVVIRFSLGKNKKGNSIIHIELQQGDYIYSRLIQRDIEKYFS